MADAEEDNIFEDEQKIIDYAEQELSDDESSAEDDGAASRAKREKKEKKKRKFNEMKEKKKLTAMQSKSSEPLTDVVVDAAGQLDLYLSHKEPNVPMDFSEHNFLTLPSQHNTGADNRIISTIDLAFPSRSDLLRLPEATEEGCCSPSVLVVCSGARRGCDVINSLSRNFKCKIGKLFAKHFRIQDQIEILKSTHFPLAVGTPNRLHKLVEMGALCLSQTVLVLVDMSEDVKGFNVMSLSDTKKDFYSFMSTYCSQEKSHLKIACVKDDIVTAPTKNLKISNAHRPAVKATKNNKKFRSQGNFRK